MDADFALALSLQFDDENEEPEILSTVNSPPFSDMGLATKNYINRTLSSASSAARRPLSVVDESWELIDPIPNIRDLFLQFNDAYFDGKLAGVEVKWSPKMTLCAGVCSYEGRGGLCSIRLSEPLLKLRPRKDLVQTLLHEMIHALLFVTQNNKDHDSHGPEFHKHMYRINQQSGANVTVYHSFHDEVNNYRQHWWKCDGPCRFRPPFYGIVRRSMNRAPSKNDNWWHEHSMSCGGKFHKIKEPEDYGKKSSKRKRDDDKGAEIDAKVDKKSLSKSQDISKWFKSSQNSGKTIIKTINSYSSNEKQKEKRESVFSGNGRSLLVPGEVSASISKDEWVKSLMQKQVKLSQGKDGNNALGKRELPSENERVERTVPSTVELRVGRDEKENVDVKDRQRGHTIFDKKKGISLNEGLGLPLVSSSSKSSELSFKIISSTASSVSSPSISQLPVTPSSSDGMTSIPGGQKCGKKEKPDIVVIDSSPSGPILKLVDCPACPKKIPVDSINMHLDQCLCRGV